MTEKKLHPNSLALHAGFRSDPATNSVAPPIYQTTSYQFDDTKPQASHHPIHTLGLQIIVETQIIVEGGQIVKNK